MSEEREVKVCEFKVNNLERTLRVVVDVWPYKSTLPIKQACFSPAVIKYYKRNLPKYLERISDTAWRIHHVKNMSGTKFELFFKASPTYYISGQRGVTAIKDTSKVSNLNNHHGKDFGSMSRFVNEGLANIRDEDQGERPLDFILKNIIAECRLST